MDKFENNHFNGALFFLNLCMDIKEKIFRVRVMRQVQLGVFLMTTCQETSSSLFLKRH